MDTDAVFRADARARLRRTLKRLQEKEWEALNLGSAALRVEGARGIPVVVALHARSFEKLLEKLPRAEDLNAREWGQASGLHRALTELRWASRRPATIASSPQQVPLDQYLI